MPTDKEIDAAAKLIKGDFDYSAKLLQGKDILEAAEKVRAESTKETEYGDIGKDSADRLYKNVLGKWVAQGRSSTPVHPVKIIARWKDGEYYAFEATPRRDISTAPKDGSQFYIGISVRWKPYKPQARKQGYGEGRYQVMNEYGGWVNLGYKPEHWYKLPKKED